MSGKLMATLFVPYLIISILGTIDRNLYNSNPNSQDELINQMIDIQMSDIDTVGTTTQTEEQKEHSFMSGFSFLTDATGTMFGFAKLLFQTLTLDYSWWSDCKKSTDGDPGYDSLGNPLNSPTGECYINASKIQSKDAPLPYVLVRYFILILALPAIFILLYKSAELFARFVNAAGSGFSAITSFIKGIG